MSENTDNIKIALRDGESLFFPDSDKAFRKAFIQRWYSSIREQYKRRTRAQEGTHNGNHGTFVWTEESK